MHSAAGASETGTVSSINAAVQGNMHGAVQDSRADERIHAPQASRQDGLPPPRDPEEAWKRRMASWSGQPSSADSIGSGRVRCFPAWGGISLASFLISAVLFALIWSVYQLDSAWARRAQSVIATALQEPFRTNQVMSWYESVFGGSPAWIPLWQDGMSGEEAQAVHSDRLSDFHAPVRGEIVSTFAESKQGVRIRVNADEPVLAAAEGRIVFCGYTSSGWTVVIQHPDQVRTIYGWLTDVVVEENDWVEQGDRIAQGVAGPDPSSAGELFFAVRAGDEYVDPAVVVTFD
mgnify:CR=1 FL=1